MVISFTSIKLFQRISKGSNHVKCCLVNKLLESTNRLPSSIRLCKYRMKFVLQKGSGLWSTPIPFLFHPELAVPLRSFMRRAVEGSFWRAVARVLWQGKPCRLMLKPQELVASKSYLNRFELHSQTALPNPLKSMIFLSGERSSRQVCGTTRPRSEKSSFGEGKLLGQFEKAGDNIPRPVLLRWRLYP